MARGPCDPVERKPPLGYRCHDGDEPTVEDYYSIDGIPVVQGPIDFCGTGDPICEGDSVSGCISDTDGAPTTYGVAPAAPSPGDVAGNSPRFSRVRINREGLPPLPYSTQKRPDQLLDLTLDGDPVDFDPVTGRFALPAYPTPEDPPDPPPPFFHAQAVSEASYVAPGDTLDPNVIISTTETTLTNPSLVRPMHVSMTYTLAAGFTLAGTVIAPGVGGSCSIVPRHRLDGTWTVAWSHYVRANKDADPEADSWQFTYRTAFDIVAGGDVVFGLGLMIVPTNPFEVVSIEQVSLFALAEGWNYDTP